MRNKVIRFALILGGALVITSGVHDIQSDGAPIASTNAPGETTCNRSSCHTGSALNSGSGTLEIEFGDRTAQYVPGSIYDITISLAQPGIARFGFQALALRDGDSTNAGEFVVTDSSRTHVFSGINQYSGRNYMTYKYPGTNPFAPGLGQWSFKWIAPVDNPGTITFYAAAAAANNDGTDNGDSIYTQQLTLQPVITSVNSHDEKLFTGIFPNPAVEDLQIFYSVKNQGATAIYLTDALSRKSDLLLQQDDAPGKHTMQIALQPKYASGLYFLTIINGTSADTRKLIIK